MTASRLRTSTESPRSRSGLLRILGFWDGIAVVVGVIIGSGILRTPGIIAGELGRPVAIFGIWVVGALVALASSLVLAELVAQIPRVGGKYVYARAAFGPLAGFVTGWSEILSRGMTAAAKAVVMGEYLLLLSGAAEPAKWAVRSIAVVVAVAFAGLHWLGLRPVRAFQNTATFLKMIILLGVSALAFTLGRGFRWEAPPEEPVSTLAWLGAFAVAFQAVTFTYYGYDEATKLAEEVRDPQRELPRILIVGILVVAGIYLLVNAGFLFVLSPAEMAGSTLVARDVAARLLGGGAAAFVTLAALVVLLGSINVNFLSLPRVGLALAQDGLAPRMMTQVSVGGTPRPALLVATAVIMIAALSASFTTLIFFIMFIALSVDGLVVLGLYRLRRLHPEWERPYRVPLYPVLPAVVLVIYAAFLVAIAIRYPLPAALAGIVLALLTVAGVSWTRKGPGASLPGAGTGRSRGNSSRRPIVDQTSAWWVL